MQEISVVIPVSTMYKYLSKYHASTSKSTTVLLPANLQKEVFTETQIWKFKGHEYLIKFKNLLLKIPCTCLLIKISPPLALQILFV